MRLVIGCIDGSIHKSDDISEEQIQNELDAVDGKIGDGAFAHITVNTVDEFCDFMVAMALSNFPDEDFVAKTFHMNIEGRQRVFKPDSIIWAEVRR